MPHLWVRAEQRPLEARVGITPRGVTELLARGFTVTVEQSPQRAIDIEEYAKTGCTIAGAHSWQDAPEDAIIFGLKELDEDGPDLRHRHMLFGHAYKGQAGADALLGRFRRGGGTLLDLESLTDADGRRVAAFGYWAGFAGAAVGLMALAEQPGVLGAVTVYDGKEALLGDLRRRMRGTGLLRAIIIGAKGRVGSGASDLCRAMGVAVTEWDMAETAHGGPFPEVLEHDIFVNCILAAPGVPIFVPPETRAKPTNLRVIADVSCDPTSDYNPVPVYNAATSFDDPVVRVRAAPAPLDVMAIDNLPSLLPVESSEDYAAQLLPHLAQLPEAEDPATGVWGRAEALFHKFADRD